MPEIPSEQANQGNPPLNATIQDEELQDIDSNVRSLISVLNSFPGVETTGSCGGHPEPRKIYQWPSGSWNVVMHIKHNRTGLLSLEFLAWAINHDIRRSKGNRILFLPTAPPPWLNGPGQCLYYVLEGSQGEDPEKLAITLGDLKKTYFRTRSNRRYC